MSETKQERWGDWHLQRDAWGMPFWVRNSETHDAQQTLSTQDVAACLNTPTPAPDADAVRLLRQALGYAKEIRDAKARTELRSHGFSAGDHAAALFTDWVKATDDYLRTADARASETREKIKAILDGASYSSGWGEADLPGYLLEPEEMHTLRSLLGEQP